MRRHRMILIAATVAAVAVCVWPIRGATGAEPNVAWKSDAAMHAYFTNAFLGADGNGFSRTLAPQMQITDFMWLTLDSGTFKLGTVELIGVARHDSPVAFVSVHHRNPGTPSQTRALTAFETESLEKLGRGMDVTSETRRNTRTVVGALRADATCLRCHNAYQAGDVLGALSFRLDTASLSPAVSQ